MGLLDLLGINQENEIFCVGDILKVPRRIGVLRYYHFGVYVGGNQVVHFTNYGPNNDIFDGFNMKEARIQKTSIDIFADGASISVDKSEFPMYSGYAVAERAESRIGDLYGDYNVVDMNCEHFANWCRTNTYKCNQSRFVLMQILDMGAFRL